MLKDLAAAFDRQDYRTAAQLLTQLQQQSPQDVWVRFYTARLREVTGKIEEAEEIYRQLLQESANAKVVGQARQGIERLEALLRSQRQAALAEATTDPQNQVPGFLVLEAVAGNQRESAIQNLARVMGVDAYSARSLLPVRGWRLYRSGPIGELQVYGAALQKAGLPVFWASFPAIEKIALLRVSYFQAIAPEVDVICRNEQDQLGKITFSWPEVRQQVEGRLPIFEQVLDLGYRDRLIWKESTQDYARFFDLHLPSRNCILRLHDSAYAYEKGIPVISQQSAIASVDRNTIRTNWNSLVNLLKHQLIDIPLWSDFTSFGESASDFASPLSRIKSHIYLSRATDSYWDAAFHLYSSLAYLRQKDSITR